jgi:Ca2+-binding RTX toxin-like protein
MSTSEDFLGALRMRESSDNYQTVNTFNFLGAYQFGEAALIDLGFVRHDGDAYDNNYGGGWTGRFGVTSVTGFLRNQQAQDQAANEWLELMWNYIKAQGLDDYAWTTVGDVYLTPSGMLAGAHLLGVGALDRFITSGGSADLRDAYGTPIRSYITEFADYDIPFASAGGNDAVQSSVTIDLDANAGVRSVERLTLTGSGNINGIGNALDNRLTGNSGNNALTGGVGEDTLVGLGGNDTLYGDAFCAGYALPKAQQVYRLYLATLDRAPDTAGQADWTARLAEGTGTLAQVAAGITGSREFQNVYGALNNSQFVTLLYQNVLNRTPDPAGLASWVAQLNAGASRAEVVTGFSESAEFVRATMDAATAFTVARVEAGWTDDVFRLYQATLDRAPDEAGFMDWLGRLGSGTTFLSAVSGFVGSGEFQRTYGALDNTEFVALLYRNVLDRAPDAAGLADWLDRLAGGTSRAQVVEGFAQGREFVSTTAGAVKDFVRSLGGGDELAGGAGTNRLWGGILADTFVFDATQGGQHRVMDLEAWDHLSFGNFGYEDAADIRAKLVQLGDDVVFEDQGVRVTLVNMQLAALADDMFMF